MLKVRLREVLMSSCNDNLFSVSFLLRVESPLLKTSAIKRVEKLRNQNQIVFTIILILRGPHEYEEREEIFR